VNTPGGNDDNVVAPPASDGVAKGIVEKPKQDEEPPIWTKVEIESTYPAGPEGWLRFLNKNLHYPEDAQNNEISGVVMVQFIVDEKGNVSNVQAVSGPESGGLREEAVRVIKKSGNWTAAIQNGRQVKSYKRQPITFKMGDSN
jgi:protein TonB